jgi:hypothetical protein
MVLRKDEIFWIMVLMKSWGFKYEVSMPWLEWREDHKRLFTQIATQRIATDTERSIYNTYV